ncbi:MAG: ATP-binding protein [Coriobacteriales bacterium]|jgi:hypothetical protein|nr:ATP-binding protein [Coriobacteriales bacterium]
MAEKKEKKNPFTPSFGSVPPLMAGRATLIADYIHGLGNGPGDPNYASILIGARGCGKTALLTKIATEVGQYGWIAAEVASGPGLLEDILERTAGSGREFLEQPARSHITSVSAAGMGIARSFQPDKTGNWRTQMNKMLDQLAVQDVGLLISVDEVDAADPELHQLVTNFQFFVREGRKVALLLAGLPQNVSELLQNKTISFLRRAYQHHLGSVPLFDVRETMQKTVEISEREVLDPELEVMAAATGGYPFLIQLIGYHVWRQSPEQERISAEDVKRGIAFAKGMMDQMIFDTTVKELSEGDLKFLLAMLPDEAGSTTAEIAKRMGVTTNYAGQYRRRLIEQGIIEDMERGRLDFAIPMLREYLEEKSVE